MVPQPDGKLALLDEYWFFHNVLSRSLPRLDRRRPSVHVSSPRNNIALKAQLCPSEVSPTPPLPPLPPVARDDNRALPPARDGAADRPRPSKLLSRKLQRSCSSFDGHSKYPESMSPNRPSTRRNQQWAQQDIKKIEGARRRFGRLERWMSLSGLEWFEVQGCKDLGFFVFGNEGGMDPRLERVIPGINRDRSPTAGVVDEKVISRPYLAESWLFNRSAPPPTVSRWRERSGDDMKEQLRFWARAVACNVRLQDD